MRKMMLYILIGLVVILGVGFLFGIRGLSETQRLQINNVDLSEIADGTYQGKYEKGRFVASVEVAVKNNKIVDVRPLGSERAKGLDKKSFEQIYPATIEKVIATQSPRVDAVSGATATTKALLKAIENALIGAGASPVGK